MFNVRVCRCLMVVSVVLAAQGCSERESKSKVEGVLLFNNNPVEGATITFMPDGDKGRTATGMTDKDGSFKMLTNNVEGVIAGNYKVVVTKVKPGQAPVQDTAGKSGPEIYQEMIKKNKGGPGGMPNLSAKSEIPDKYTAAGTTDLRCTVPVDGKITFKMVK